MVRVRTIKGPRVKELVSPVKIVSSKKAGETLESEVASADNEREEQFISSRAAPGNTPTLRTAPLAASPSSSTVSTTPPQRTPPESREGRPATYTPRTDAELYTALSTQSASARYNVMHGESKADERLATRARVTTQSPSLGPRSGTIALPQDRTVNSLQSQDPFTLRSAWQDDTLDKRYDMYREDSLQDANKPRRVRR